MIVGYEFKPTKALTTKQLTDLFVNLRIAIPPQAYAIFPKGVQSHFVPIEQTPPPGPVTIDQAAPAESVIE